MTANTSTIHDLASLERAIDHPDDNVRLQVLQLIAQNPQRARAFSDGTRDVIDALDERISREPVPAMRVTMLTSLASLGHDPRIIERMVHEAQQAEGAMEHMISLSYLAQHDHERAGPFARRLLFSQNRDQIRIAASLLGEQRELTPPERVRLQVVNPHRSNRGWSDAHLEALRKELDGPFAASARELVEVHHPELLDPLVTNWDSLSKSSQRWLVQSCDRFPLSRSVSTLLEKATRHSDEGIIVLALKQITSLGVDTLAIDPEQLRTLLSSNEGIRPQAIQAIANVDDVMNILDQETSPSILTAALHRLARIEPDALSVEQCGTWLDHEHWRVRAAASFLLAHRSDLDQWISGRWSDLTERARVGVARAGLEQNRDQALEANLTGAWAS